MNAVWCVSGMHHFGRVVSDALGWRLFVDAPVLDADTVLIIGMYDPPNYNYTLKMTQGAKKRVIFWCGSDIQALVRPDMLPDATHIAEAEWSREVLLAKGVSVDGCVTFPTSIHPKVTPLPEDDVVACYLGSNPSKYGESMLRALAELMPDVKFRAYTYGMYDSNEMLDVIADAKVYLRLVYPDGSATSAREYMEAGRRAITTVPVDYATVVKPDDLSAIASAVRRALRESEPDYEAAAYYHEFNSVERFVDDVRGLL